MFANARGQHRERQMILNVWRKTHASRARLRQVDLEAQGCGGVSAMEGEWAIAIGWYNVCCVYVFVCVRPRARVCVWLCACVRACHVIDREG